MNCQNCPKRHVHENEADVVICIDFCELWNKDTEEVTADECGVKYEL
jgi:hypothetical protein